MNSQNPGRAANLRCSLWGYVVRVEYQVRGDMLHGDNNTIHIMVHDSFNCECVLIVTAIIVYGT